MGIKLPEDNQQFSTTGRNHPWWYRTKNNKLNYSLVNLISTLLNYQVENSACMGIGSPDRNLAMTEVTHQILLQQMYLSCIPGLDLILYSHFSNF